MDKPYRKYRRSDAAKLSLSDIQDIMQYRDLKSKPLKDLAKKYKTSYTRLYKIWREEAADRIDWHHSIPKTQTNTTNNLSHDLKPSIGTSKLKKRLKKESMPISFFNISQEVKPDDILALCEKKVREVEKIKTQNCKT
jgi:hypothetical protein